MYLHVYISTLVYVVMCGSCNICPVIYTTPILIYKQLSWIVNVHFYRVMFCKVYFSGFYIICCSDNMNNSSNVNIYTDTSVLFHCQSVHVSIVLNASLANDMCYYVSLLSSKFHCKEELYIQTKQQTKPTMQYHCDNQVCIYNMPVFAICVHIFSNVQMCKYYCYPGPHVYYRVEFNGYSQVHPI